MSQTQPLSEQDLLRLQAYIDGEASETEIASFEKELAQNVALAAELERWLALTETVSPEYVPEFEPQFDPAPAVLARLELEAPVAAYRLNGIVLFQLILGVVLLLAGWPLVNNLRPQGMLLATAAGVGAVSWFKRLAGWINEQQVATWNLFSNLDLGSPFSAGPEMVTFLLIIGAVGGLIWLLSVRYILRTTDWRPAGR